MQRALVHSHRTPKQLVRCLPLDIRIAMANQPELERVHGDCDSVATEGLQPLGVIFAHEAFGYLTFHHAVTPLAEPPERWKVKSTRNLDLSSNMRSLCPLEPLVYASWSSSSSRLRRSQPSSVSHPVSCVFRPTHALRLPYCPILARSRSAWHASVASGEVCHSLDDESWTGSEGIGHGSWAAPQLFHHSPPKGCHVAFLPRTSIRSGSCISFAPHAVTNLTSILESIFDITGLACMHTSVFLIM